MLDYINQDDKIKPFINHFPNIDNFSRQIEEKKHHNIDRISLVNVLLKQNASLNLSDCSQSNINKLKSNKSFTITTGHQLCLFMGPLFVIYKIISAINLANQLKKKYNKYEFVPVFWMASEDHDLQEINHINYFGKKITWNTNQTGAVGRMSLDGVESMIEEYFDLIGESFDRIYLERLFKESYLNNNTLVEATRFLVNQLFGKYGIVIIDGDDKELKSNFIPIIKKDILDSAFSNEIRLCSENLENHYNSQAFVRDINFFKLSKGKRELITKKLAEKDIINFPENLSPNVLLRPLYQECVLPNIGVIGGGSELAYWMQLRTVFKKEKIPFPILILRNSIMLVAKRKLNAFKDLGFQIANIFEEPHFLEKKLVLSKGDITFHDEKDALKLMYETLINKTSDKGLHQSILGQLKKNLNYLDSLEKKIIRLAKKDHETSINKIRKLKEELFPENTLQERYCNFIPFTLKGNEQFIKTLIDNINPLDANFVVLSY